MKKTDDSKMDTWLLRVASGFDYPATPDLSRLVQRRAARQSLWSPRRIQLAWGVLALLLALSMLMLVPQVRASVMSILRSGGITVFVSEPRETAAASTPLPAPVNAGGGRLETEFLTPMVETSPEVAQEAFGRPHRLPVAAGGAGAPAQAYVDDLKSAQIAVLVWTREGAPAYVLYVMKQATLGYKLADAATTTTVGDDEALWVEGPHGFMLEKGEIWQETAGSVLIWTIGELTYRLEGAESLPEAQQFAESLR